MHILHISAMQIWTSPFDPSACTAYTMHASISHAFKPRWNYSRALDKLDLASPTAMLCNRASQLLLPMGKIKRYFQSMGQGPSCGTCLVFQWNTLCRSAFRDRVSQALSCPYSRCSHQQKRAFFTMGHPTYVVVRSRVYMPGSNGPWREGCQGDKPALVPQHPACIDACQHKKHNKH